MRKRIKKEYLRQLHVLLLFLVSYLAITGYIRMPELSGPGVIFTIPTNVEGLISTSTPTVQPAVSTNPVNDQLLLQVITATPNGQGENVRPLIRIGPGDVTLPILLYHHIYEDSQNSRYSISISQFRQQMDLLNNLGYQTTTVQDLNIAISKGADLPQRPIIITFDDGAEDVYTNAFPIMESYGFTGTIFIVGNYIDAEGFMSVDQIKELHKAGWEVGSHSMNHADLFTTPSLSDEIFKSKKYIGDRTGIKIESFAYPFGIYNEFLAKKVLAYGYKAALGLGWVSQHNENSKFFLSRIEVKHTLPLYGFNSKLPWKLNSDRYIKLYPD